MKIQEKAILHNRFDVKVVDAKSGKVKQTAVAYNVITNYYFNSRLTASPLSKTSDLFRYIAIGTGTGTPKITDTALFTHLTRKAVTTLETVYEYSTSYTTKQIKLEATECNGYNITEVALEGYTSGTFSTYYYIMSHAMLQDSEGNQIAIAKTDTDVVYITATFYATCTPSGFGTNGIYPKAESNYLARWLLTGSTDATVRFSRFPVEYSSDMGVKYHGSKNHSFSDGILIHKYDRVARSLAEHVKLESRLREKNIKLVAVAQDFGGSNEALIMRALMWTLSEYYNLNLADETRKGLKEKALKGMHTGGYPPFGYDVVKQRYVINDLEAGYVRRLFQAALNRTGYKDILAEMEAAGITGKRGKPIKYTQVYEMLRNEKYTGTYTYSPTQEKNRADRRSKPNGIKIENALPIIIDKAVFMEVQKIMDGRKQTGNNGKYLCSGLVFCSCGVKMHGRTSKRGDYEHRYYSCSAKCGAPSVPADSVEDAARKYLKDLLSPENQTLIAAALRKYNQESSEGAEIFKAATKSKIKEKQKQYDNLFGNMTSGVLTGKVLEDVMAEMNSLQAEIAALEEAEPPKDYTPDTVTAWLESLKAAPDEKAIQLLIERIDVDNSGQKETTEFNVSSTLNSVVSENGCGGRI